MKKVIEYLKGLMVDKQGKPARKMHFALASFVISVIIAFVLKDVNILNSFLIFTGACLGFSSLDKFSQK